MEVLRVGTSYKTKQLLYTGSFAKCRTIRRQAPSVCQDQEGEKPCGTGFLQGHEFEADKQES